MWVCEDIVKGNNNDIGNRHTTTHNSESICKEVDSDIKYIITITK